MLSKKRPPISPDSDMNRIIQQIYTDLNEIINAVNQGDSKLEKLNNKEGKKIIEIEIIPRKKKNKNKNFLIILNQKLNYVF